VKEAREVTRGINHVAGMDLSSTDVMLDDEASVTVEETFGGHRVGVTFTRHSAEYCSKHNADTESGTARFEEEDRQHTTRQYRQRNNRANTRLGTEEALRILASYDKN
jgi:hypothetical protein